MRAPITLKFSTQKGSPKVNSSIKFGANPMNGSGVMTNYSRKTRTICDRIHEKVPFSHILQASKQNSVTFVSIY